MAFNWQHEPVAALTLARRAWLQLPALISNLLMKREAAFQHGSRRLKGGAGEDRQQKELRFLKHIKTKERKEKFRLVFGSSVTSKLIGRSS